jgi:hypothetical protein
MHEEKPNAAVYYQKSKVIQDEFSMLAIATEREHKVDELQAVITAVKNELRECGYHTARDIERARVCGAPFEERDNETAYRIMTKIFLNNATPLNIISNLTYLYDNKPILPMSLTY